MQVGHQHHREQCLVHPAAAFEQRREEQPDPQPRAPLSRSPAVVLNVGAQAPLRCAVRSGCVPGQVSPNLGTVAAYACGSTTNLSGRNYTTSRLVILSAGRAATARSMSSLQRVILHASTGLGATTGVHTMEGSSMCSTG